MEKYWTQTLAKAGKPVHVARYQKEPHTVTEDQKSAAARRLKRKSVRKNQNAVESAV